MTDKDRPRPKRERAAHRPAAARSKASLDRLEAENEVLRKQLVAAEQRIATLERQRDEALNRMAWVIDSINSLAESIR